MTAQQQVDASELFNLLEDRNIKVAEEIKALIHDNLNSTREAWLLNGLVDYYMATQSENGLDVLGGIREPHDKHLFDKLNEHMKEASARVQTLTLLSYIVKRQPSWLHKISNHQLFNTILKILKTDNDIPILMSACLIITTLLPVIPVSVGGHLQEIFLVFTRLAGFSLKKPANVPDIFLLHLQVGVYALFHRLYGMYPCNFLAFLRLFYSKKDRSAMPVFDQTIKPMLERVRMHPQLVTGSKEKELSTTRWRTMEIHDITIECAKMSLDMIEGTAEGHRRPIFPMFGQRTSIDSVLWMEPPQTPIDTQATQLHTYHQTYPSIYEHQASDQYSLVNQQLKCSSTDLWSPSSVCGLMTPPPSQQTTPSQSVSDLVTTSITSHQGYVSSTPTIATPTLRQSPPSHDESGNYGTSKSAKRKSGLQTPVTGQSSIQSPGMDHTGLIHSPLKKDFTSEPPSQARRMAAKKLELPINTKQLDSSVESSQKLNRSISEYDAKKNCDIEKMAAEKLTHPEKLGTIGQSHSVPVLLNKSDCVETESRDESEEFRTASELSASQSDPVKFQVSDHSVPVNLLPQVIEKLSEADSEDISQVHDADDDEVSTINCTRVGGHLDTESCDHSVRCQDPQLTAQSMQQFMKNVNRIRFNSMNTNADPGRKVLDKKERGCKRVRCNSCPDFKPKSECDVNSAGYSLAEEAEPTDSFVKSVSEGVKCSSVTSQPSTQEISVTQQTTVTTTVKRVYPLAPPIQSLPTQLHGHLGPSIQPPFIDTGTDHSVPRPLPYEDLFPLSLPYTPITQCQNCMERSYVPPDLMDVSTSTLQPQMTSTTPPRVLGTEVPLFTALSPPELLDRQIQLGSDVHAKELSHIPLTSGESISWTHFGGVPPSDEVNILRGQNMLLHTQMMYERHKREQHAIRNRRLLGKIVKNVALEEQNSAMKDQLQLQEGKIEELQKSLQIQQYSNRRLTEEKNVMELEKESELVKLRRSEEELEYKTKELQSMLVAEKEEKKTMLKELQSIRSMFFNLNEEMVIMEMKVQQTNKLQDQVTRLNKEMLLMGELQKKYQEKMAALAKNNTGGFEQRQIIEANKNEIEDLKSLLNHSLLQCDSLRARMAELDDTIKNKDVIITDQKRSIEKIKSIHQEKLESVNEKYRSQQNVIQGLEAHILELHHRYSRSHRHSSSHRSHDGKETNREASPEEKTNGYPHRTRPIKVQHTASLDHAHPSSQDETDVSNNAQTNVNRYLTQSITTDAKTAFQRYKPQEINSYPQYCKPTYSNFMSASEGQRYVIDSTDHHPSFLMPYDSVIKHPEDLEVSAADHGAGNFLTSHDLDDSTPASRTDTRDEVESSINLDSGIASYM